MASEILRGHPEVMAAVASQRPVVALESTIFTHGLPAPDGARTALALEAIVRDRGAVPATIGMLDGELIVGMSEREIERLATTSDARKLSRADLAHAAATGACGATTVAATMFAAHRTGIGVFATGGIGGVHREVERTMDISADLGELSRTRVCVVASGAKSILDLPRTLELLETLGVPVIGFGTDELPAFFVRSSGLRLTQRVDDAMTAARVIAAQRTLGLETGVLLAVPPPAESALDGELVAEAIEAALESAARAGVRGKRATPHLLAEVRARTGGASLDANVALVKNNARVAADVAVALAAMSIA